MSLGGSTSQTASETPFRMLAAIAARAKKSARELPAQNDVQVHWSGIGFEILGHALVAPMSEVSEMLEVPAYTRLPGVQPWVKGVANVRGRLLPLFDLPGICGDKLRLSRKSQRVLVIEFGEVFAGLVVDRVLGVKHFFHESYYPEEMPVAESLKGLMQGGFYENQEAWPVLSFQKLLEDPIFMNAAATQAGA